MINKAVDKMVFVFVFFLFFFWTDVFLRATSDLWSKIRLKLF